MDTLPLITALIAAAVGGLTAPALVRFANRTVASTPTGIDRNAEARLLTCVLSDPHAYRKVTELQADDFSHPAHARIWAALEETAAAPAQPSVGLPDKVPDLVIDVEDARATLDSEDQTLFDGLADGAATGERELLADGRQILTGSQTLAMPVSVPIQSDRATPRYDPAPPSQRRLTSVTVLGVALAGASAVAAPLLLAEGAGLTATLLLTVALLSFCAGSIVIALVDIDILEIPVRTLALTATLAGGLGVAAVALAGGYQHGSGSWSSGLLAAAAVCVFIVVLFEGLNLMFRWLRGHDGQGLGDTLLVPLVFGFPVLATGDGLVAYFILLTAAFAAAAVWAVRRVVTGQGRDVPVPFGPMLVGAAVTVTLLRAAGVLPTLL